MDQDRDRPTRSQRYRSDAGEEVYNEQLPPESRDQEPSSTRRRRRSQATRIQSDAPATDSRQAPAYDEPSPREAAYREEPREYRREARSPYEAEDTQPRRYARPAAEQPAPRKASRARYEDDDLYGDDPYRDDDLYGEDEPYRRKEPAARGSAARSAPAKKAKARRPAKDEYDDYDEYDDPYYDDEDEEEPRKRHTLRWVIIVLVILALLAGVTFVVRQNPDLVEPMVQWARGLIAGDTPEPEVTPEPTPEATPTAEPIPEMSAAKVVDFAADPSEQPDVSLPVTFQMTTTAQTDRVQVVNSNGETLIEAGEGEYSDTEFGRVWTLMVYFPEAYEGNVEAYPGNESGWNEASGASISVRVGDPSAAGAVGSSTSMLVNEGSVAQTMETDGFVFDKDGEITPYTRAHPIQMADADNYQGENGMNGVLTFRGSAMRQNAAFGTVTATELKLSEIWTADVGIPDDGDHAFGAQPIIVQWHANIREMMAMNAEKSAKNQLKEVIFASNNGNLYYFDLDDGQATREPLQINPTMPMLGSASVYPKGLPMLFVGSGDPANLAPEEDTGLLVYNLIKNSDIGILKGINANAFSSDGSFTTSALLDNNSDTIIGVGGNGLLYTMYLNSSIDGTANTLNITPTVEIFRVGKQGEDTRVDSSLAVHGELAYYATNGGMLVCVNLNTMEVVWALNVGADTDAAVALENTDSGGTVLYLATKSDVEGLAHMRCIDAATGKVNWDASAPGTITASPLVGTGVLKGQVFFSVRNSEAGGTVYALDSSSGSLLWEYVLVGTKLASPVAIYDEVGGAWIVQGDDGGLLLLNALTGERVDYLALDGAVYGSPAAFNNIIVVATETGKLHGVQIR